MSRRPQQPGLTYYESNAGCLIRETPELLDMKARIRELRPDAHFNVFFDFDQELYIITQVLEDNTEELVLTTKELNEQEIKRRIWEGRPERSADEFLADLDKENAQIERDKEREFEDQLGDAGERLAHALKKDGVVDHEDIHGGRSN